MSNVHNNLEMKQFKDESSINREIGRKFMGIKYRAWMDECG